MPAAQLGSNVWILLLMAGIYLHMTSLVWAGVILFAFAVLFQVVTLPVEIDASRRAMSNINAVAQLDAHEHGGAKSMLTAAAMTYIAAALSSIIMLVYYLGLARSNN